MSPDQDFPPIYRTARCNVSAELYDIKMHKGEYLSAGIWHRYSPEAPHGDGGDYSVVEIKVHPVTGRAIVSYDARFVDCKEWPR